MKYSLSVDVIGAIYGALKFAAYPDNADLQEIKRRCARAFEVLEPEVTEFLRRHQHIEHYIDKASDLGLLSVSSDQRETLVDKMLSHYDELSSFERESAEERWQQIEERWEAELRAIRNEEEDS